MTIKQAKSEIMQIYGALSPDKQRAIDTVLHTIEQNPSNVREHDKDHIWYKGKQYISLNRFLQVKEPCEDAISRDELLKAIDTWDKFGCDADTKLVPYQDHYVPYIHYDDVVKCIKGMPSVNPQETKIGHWIPTYGNVMCSVCGGTQDSRNVGKATHYCKYCGAKMGRSDKE